MKASLWKPLIDAGLVRHVSILEELESLPNWEIASSWPFIIPTESGPSVSIRVQFSYLGKNKKPVRRVLSAELPVLEQVFWKSLRDDESVKKAVSIVGKIPGLSHVESLLSQEARRLRSDDKFKKKASEKLSKARGKSWKKEHRSLVVRFDELIERGWTKKDVLGAWNEAMCRGVHEK